jgi:hypothetical protein
MNYLSGNQWRKSSFSGNSGNCVEVRTTSQTATVAVRDSKHAAGPELAITADRWAAFLRGVKKGQFDPS